MGQPKKGVLLTRLPQIREAGIVGAVAVVYVALSTLSPAFRTYSNALVILTMTSYVAIVAIGATMILTCGEIDLSFGSIYGLTAMVFAYLLQEAVPGNISAAILMATVVAAGCGVLNGTMTLYSRVPSFIITLGTMLAFGSVTLIISNAWPILVSQTELERNLIGGDIGGFPVMAIWMIIVAVTFWIILEKTRLGNWISATGDRLWAAQAAGINTNLVKLVCFVFLAVLSGLAGIMNSSRLGVSSPIGGSGLLFDAIGASIVGGTSLTGGSGTIIGSILGALLIAEINDGLSVIGVPTFWYNGFVGSAIVVASIINTVIRRRM